MQNKGENCQSRIIHPISVVIMKWRYFARRTQKKECPTTSVNPVVKRGEKRKNNFEKKE